VLEKEIFEVLNKKLCSWVREKNMARKALTKFKNPFFSGTTKFWNATTRSINGMVWLNCSAITNSTCYITCFNRESGRPLFYIFSLRFGPSNNLFVIFVISAYVQYCKSSS
jgi:hypothetical protein